MSMELQIAWEQEDPIQIWSLTGLEIYMGNGRESKYKVYRVEIIPLMFVDLSMF